MLFRPCCMPAMPLYICRVTGPFLELAIRQLVARRSTAYKRLNLALASNWEVTIISPSEYPTPRPSSRQFKLANTKQDDI
jgi:hypothetical protein